MPKTAQAAKLLTGWHLFRTPDIDLDVSRAFA
jgi:hypothetical protein